MEEGQGGSHEEEWLSRADLGEEGVEIKALVFEEEGIGEGRAESAEHVAEGGVREFVGGGGEIEMGQAGVIAGLPGFGERVFVEIGVWEVVDSFDFGGGAGGEKLPGGRFLADEGEIGELEGVGGNGGDFLPFCH